MDPSSPMRKPNTKSEAGIFKKMPGRYVKLRAFNEDPLKPLKAHLRENEGGILGIEKDELFITLPALYPVLGGTLGRSPAENRATKRYHGIGVVFAGLLIVQAQRGIRVVRLQQ